MEVGLGPGHIVLDGDTAPSPKKGQSPQFLAHVYCGQTAGWIKTPLDTEVNLGPGNFVLDGFPAMSIVAKLLDGSRWHLAWRWALVKATLC